MQDLLGPSIEALTPNDTTQFNALNDVVGAQYAGRRLHLIAAQWMLHTPSAPMCLTRLPEVQSWNGCDWLAPALGKRSMLSCSSSMRLH